MVSEGWIGLQGLVRGCLKYGLHNQWGGCPKYHITYKHWRYIYNSNMITLTIGIMEGVPTMYDLMNIIIDSSSYLIPYYAVQSSLIKYLFSYWVVLIVRARAPLITPFPNLAFNLKYALTATFGRNLPYILIKSKLNDILNPKRHLHRFNFKWKKWQVLFHVERRREIRDFVFFLCQLAF